MEAVAASESSLRAFSRRAFGAIQQRPVLLLVGGAALLAVGAGLVAAHVTVFALDETLIQQSAVHYTTHLPDSLVHDYDARATNRLYPLILSIAFRLFNGAEAIRIDHVLSVLMFISTIAPVFLMARMVLRSDRYAAAVAVLSVAVPWLTLTSALFTENLSYPLFWWTMLAICSAVWTPAPLRDLLALACIALLIGTRAQFAAVFLGYVLAVLLVSVWRVGQAGALSRRLRHAAAGAVRGFPFALTTFAAGVVLVAYLHLSGEWHAHVERLLGTYSAVLLPNGLPNDMAQGLLIELIALALGAGLLPAIVSLAWFAKRVSHPQWDRRCVCVIASSVVIVVFLVLTVYSQGGYLGADTEERYFFYVIPVFWMGAFAAFEDCDISAGAVLVCALALAALYGAIPFQAPLNEETAFLAPVESVVPHVVSHRLVALGVTGLTTTDALAVLVLLAGGFTALVWRWRPSARLAWTVGAAVVLQLLIAGYAYAVIDGKVHGIPGRTEGSVASLDWVDAHARSANVTWFDNLSLTAAEHVPLIAEDEARTTLFWNKTLRSWSQIPELELGPVEWPLQALPGAAALSVNRQNGLLTPAPATVSMTEIVGQTESPFLQLSGTTLARSPDGILTLTQLSRPARASWLATGLRADGSISAEARQRLFAFADTSTTAAAKAVTFTLVPPALAASSSATTELLLRLGSSARRVVLGARSAPVRVTLNVCFRAQQSLVQGSIRVLRSALVSGHRLAGALTAVNVSPSAAPGCQPAAR